LSNLDLGKVIQRIIGKGKKKSGDRSEKSSVEFQEKTKSSFFNQPHYPEKIYIKAMVLHSLEDVEKIKSELKHNNLVIIRVNPLAEKSVDEVHKAVNELIDFVKNEGGDIASLGKERIVVTPNFVEIWREKLSDNSS
jgi:SepF-like predicted cell division protein (DUF552 family)